MALQNVLVIVDPELPKQIILQRAKELAQSSSCTLHLYHSGYHNIVEILVLFEKEYMEGVKKEFVQQQIDMLEKLAEPLREEGFKVETDACWSHPVEQGIVDKIQALRPDLVMVTGHARHHIERAHSSHLDWQLIKKSDAPVWLVRLENWDQNEEVCVCVDPRKGRSGGALEQQQVVMGKRLANYFGNPLTLFHSFNVYQPPYAFDKEGLAEHIKAMEAETKQRVWTLAEDNDLDANSVQMTEGDFLKSVMEYTDQNKTQMLVMGVHTHRGLGKWLLGRSAQKVVDRVHCDLLFIKD